MKAGIFLTLMLITCKVFAQNIFYGGFFPEVAISTSIGKGYKYTGKIESMHGLVAYNSDQDQWSYFHDRTDLQSFVSYKLTAFKKLTGGIQYRIEDGINTFRSIQQISFTVLGGQYRLGHRIRADQTFHPDAPDQYRIRYRISYEKPLSGLDLNVGELYLVVSDELIYSYEPDDSDMENRLNIALGYLFDSSNKFQIGIDFRTDKIIADGLRNRAWFKMGWYSNI